MKYVKIYGSSLNYNEKPIELSKLFNNDTKRTPLDTSNYYSRVDLSWLPSASKEYCVSSDIRDYIVVPNPVVTTKFPNVNMQAFDTKILLEFDISRRRPRYKTFVGTPTFQEHDNQDNTKAKGVNIDASIVPIKKYGIAKVVVLSAFDRSKDSYLVNRMMKNKINGFSMGAITAGYICSICNGLLGPGVRRTCTCGTDYNDLRSYGKVIGNKISYLTALNPVFFENSYVDNPADISALSSIIH